MLHAIKTNMMINSINDDLDDLGKVGEDIQVTLTEVPGEMVSQFSPEFIGLW